MTQRRVLFASLIGTTIEYFDFYIYGTAAVIVFPQLFFPSSDPTTATLNSLATFGLAFFARPIGSALFGHFGDRIGRKATLVAALLTMGISTIAIGLLPTYAQIGIFAPALLALCRFGQGVGLGGEWGGAVLLAMENAPKGKETRFGMYPQLGAPLGFIGATAMFVVLNRFVSEAEFVAWAWRVPFIASAVLVIVGLWVRLKIAETPAFQRAIERQERVRVPMVAVWREHTRALVLGTLMAMTTFVLFYLMTVFTLNWGTTELGFAREDFLLLQILGMTIFCVMIGVSAIGADRLGRLPMLRAASVVVIVFGLVFGPLFASAGPIATAASMCFGLGLIGFTFGPLGTALAEIFPTAVRYTGASLTFNLAGILGGSLAPYIATRLAVDHGVAYVGYYLSAAAVITLIAQLALGRTSGPVEKRADVPAT